MTKEQIISKLMLNPKYDKGIEYIKKVIGDRDYREYYFSSPLGVPQEIL